MSRSRFGIVSRLDSSRFVSRFDSFRFSFRFDSFRFASLVRSFVRSLVRFVFVSIINLSPYRRSSQNRHRSFRSSITVRYWIYCAPAAPFVSFRVLIVLTRIIDKTTPTATLREQLFRRSIHRTLFRNLIVLLCCFVSFRWFKFNF